MSGEGMTRRSVPWLLVPPSFFIDEMDYLPSAGMPRRSVRWLPMPYSSMSDYSKSISIKIGKIP